LRGEDRLDGKDREGQGEVIEVSVRPVSLSVLDSGEELLQSGFWGAFKQAHGWRAHPINITISVGQERAAFGLLALTRRLFRLFSVAYIPFGPSYDPGNGRGEFLAVLSRALRGHLPGNTLFLRYDLPWERAGEEPRWSARGLRVVKSRDDIQPPDTVIVDISPPLDEVLAAMKSKTRYNIRLAAKKGIDVSQGGPAEYDAWYSLYRETSRRDRIAIHSSKYYRGLLELSRGYGTAAPTVKLLLARHKGEIIAGNIAVFWKRRAAYLYGASSGEKRNLMPTYALQWEAIRMAKEMGCETYDLYGIPPSPDPGHPLFGLHQFKTGFSDRVLRRWGTWDVPFRPALFALYRAAEAARMFFYRELKKRRKAR
jgi:lipid II:glycine glycyltransferase (peptidoglycan interpeptide bridge formation enzyme)